VILDARSLMAGTIVNVEEVDCGRGLGTRFLSRGDVRPTMCKGSVKNVLRLHEQPSIVLDRDSPVDAPTRG
jgi:hypothetical protein